MNSRRYKLILLLSYFIIINSGLSNAEISKSDSILISLDQIEQLSHDDSTYALNAFNLIAREKIDSALFFKIELACERIRTTPAKTLATVIEAQLLVNGKILVNDYIQIDYLKRIIESVKLSQNNMERDILIRCIGSLRIPYRNSNRIYEGIEYYLNLAKFFEHQNDSLIITNCYYALRGIYFTLGLTDRAIYCSKKSLSYLNPATPLKNDLYFKMGPFSAGLAGILNRKSVMAGMYIDLNQPLNGLKELYENVSLFERYKDTVLLKDGPYVYLQLAKAKIILQDDSVLYFLDKAYENFLNDDYTYRAYYNQLKSWYYYNQQQYDSAEIYISRTDSIKKFFNTGANTFTGFLLPGYFKALICIKRNKNADAIKFLTIEINEIEKLNIRREVLKELKLLSEVYKNIADYHNAVLTMERYNLINQTLIDEEMRIRDKSYEIEQSLNEQEKKMTVLEAENSFRTQSNYYLLGVLFLIAISTIAIFNRYLGKKKSNEHLTNTLNELKATQEQLVQQEKLASLGALTAGIAHEIKNPLNFVNNFSELSNDLVDEFLETKDDEERKEIANDLKLNLKKINEHGKRADSIVKNMLQHSRAGTGEKQLTDLNQICEEYLNLAYHGKRANTQGFNCEIIKHLDPNLPMVNCVPQDISRVILNLINNAMDELNECQKSNVKGEREFNPTLILSTAFVPSLTGRAGDGSVLVKVKDNGRGIAQHTREKIFEPFFTTKHSGQGTGLGLSISFDIIKAHGGRIEVESNLNEYTEFIITMPV